MPDLSAYPITQRWPAAHPDRIQLYSLNTPNGVKASIMPFPHRFLPLVQAQVLGQARLTVSR